MADCVWNNPLGVIERSNLAFIIGAIFIFGLVFSVASTPKIFAYGDSGIPVNITQNNTVDLSHRYWFLSQLYNIPLIGSTIQNTLNSTGLFPDVANNIKIKYTFMNQESSSWVEGKIKNTGNQTYKGIMVYFTLLDASESPVGSTYALISDVGPGEVAVFQTIPADVSAKSARIQSIIGG